MNAVPRLPAVKKVYEPRGPTMSGTALDVFAIGAVLWLMAFHHPALQIAHTGDPMFYTYFYRRPAPDLVTLVASLGLGRRAAEDHTLLGEFLFSTYIGPMSVARAQGVPRYKIGFGKGLPCSRVPDVCRVQNQGGVWCAMVCRRRGWHDGTQPRPADLP